MHDPLDDGDLAETEKINVVPLADLTLVLLIVLMVLSPMISQSMIHVSVPTVKSNLEDPKPETPEAEANSEPLLVAVTAEGYRLNNNLPVSLDDLKIALAARLEENRKRPVLVTAEKSVGVGRVVEILDFAKICEAESVSLVKSGEAEAPQQP